MRCVLQRVSSATLSIAGETHAQIGNGLVILLGICDADEKEDALWLTRKIANMRIFGDDKDLMNRSIIDSGGEALVVSQFTLYASTKKGNRPSFVDAAKPDIARPIYETFINELTILIPVKTGIFGANMLVKINNDGPVTIIIDSKEKL